MASGNLNLFARLAELEAELSYTFSHIQKGPAAIDLGPSSTLHAEVIQFLHNPERSRHARSIHLARVLREPTREFLPSDDLFIRAVDKLEYLQSLIYLDALPEMLEAPLGEYISRSVNDRFNVIEDANDNIKKLGPEWPPLKAGLFGGSVERYSAAARRMGDYLKKLRPFFAAYGI